ncbi:outer membrane lipoprotein-sorting protein [Marichromatium sp. AB32]|uniref:outer membrane lipoprotein-sorting protein n=1 Tax=Marichromatium sp. AB32 TaxID=2483363 RepID=UPI000F3DDF1D|nr:outer membrane lipoprotein-sorting protein [Marichromatium sp. AB32]RNE91145.1 outer membrane lipoprotein-sorting protein [Marichromatium sp. AB32]
MSSPSPRPQRTSRRLTPPRTHHWTTALALLLACALLTPVHADPKGERLAQQVYDRPDGRDLTTRGTMVLQERGHAPRTREMFIYRRDQGGGEVSTLIRFTAPGDIADTGLLTIDHAAGESDQWVYLPALGKPRRIPAARQGGRFVGSDLFYEDLRDRRVALDEHRWLRQETYEGVRTEVLESTPVDPGNSVYGKRLSWIHPEALVALRIDFFRPGQNQPFKRFTARRLERIQGYWTVTDSLMTDLDSGHQTRMTSTLTRYDSGLDPVLFSRRALEDPVFESRFRP